ncbi:MAG TPA: GNAT family N-acetyltransferase [Gemmatimonadaceae bacterium]|nr:GNAT family N-acetyltransferase [Gemmatimonadaceae bacterium]
MLLFFECLHFRDLTPNSLYAMLRLRSEIFVVEQNCVFLDMDGVDTEAHHLFGWNDAGREQLLCGVRILAPGVAYEEPSIGRVVTARDARGSGIGRALMLRSIDTCNSMYPGHAIRIGAQQYLERFYGSLGFVTVSEPYDEDGIRHVTMLREA